VLSPLFLLSLRQNPMIGLSLALLTTLASSFMNVLTMLQYNFPPTQMLWKQPEIFSPDFILHHLVIYIKPWYRIGPYLVGLVLGYHLAGFSNLPQKMRKRTFRFIAVGWIAALLTGFWALFGLYPALQGWNWPIYHLFYGATSRTVFSLAVGWVIYACHTGIGGPLNKLLSLPPLLPLSILSYTSYLIHMIPVVFTYVISPFPIYYTSKLYILQHCVVQLALSYCFGMICTMLAELPALNIERIMLNLGEKKTTLKPLPIQSSVESEQIKMTEYTGNGTSESKMANGIGGSIGGVRVAGGTAHQSSHPSQA